MRTKVCSVHTTDAPLKKHSHNSLLVNANSFQRNAHCKSLFCVQKYWKPFYRQISFKVTFSTLIELKQCGIWRYAPVHISDRENFDPLPEIEPVLFMSAAQKSEL